MVDNITKWTTPIKPDISYLIKSPKQSFLLLFLLLLFLFFFFLSVHHELVHGRSQELQDKISWNLVEFDMWVDSVSGRFGRLHNR